MGLGFATPAFLLGALALAIPILIHLTNRERREVVPFPSLMFLQKIPYRSVRRQKIRHWLLFCLRCLAILLLVLAFARPFLEQPGQAAPAERGSREVVILLDRSYSMGYADRWGRALARTREILGGLGLEDRATLIAFDDRAEALVQSTSDLDRVRSVLGSIELSAARTRFGPALKLAKNQLEASPLAEREVFLVSDFQKVGWEGQEDDLWLPAGTTLTPVDLSDPESSNLAITTVIVERQTVSSRERIVASARLTNKGSSPFESLDVALEVNGRLLQEKTVSIEENSSLTVSFEPFTLPESVARGSVRVEGDELAADNVFRFLLWPGQSLSVLVVEGPDASVRQNLYIRRALSIGDRPGFRIEAHRSGRLTADALASHSVVLLNDLPSLDPAELEHLKSFVSSGGGLVVLLGERSQPSVWGGAGAELLPAAWEDTVDRMSDWGGSLAYLDYSHPVFELFSAPHSGDFSTAKFFRYRSLKPASSEGVLARFDDGNVALMEKKLGEGRVLLWSSSLDTFWNDLALQPVFLPFVHQLFKHAAGYVEAESWHTVGDVLDVGRFVRLVEAADPLAAEERAERWVAVAPSGDRSLVTEQEGRQLLPLAEQGFYELREVTAENSRPMSFAVNVDLAESDLAPMDPEELVAAVSFREGAAASGALAGLTAEDQERSQSIWWYLLIVALLLLAAETVFSNRLSRAVTVARPKLGPATE